MKNKEWACLIANKKRQPNLSFKILNLTIPNSLLITYIIFEFKQEKKKTHTHRKNKIPQECYVDSELSQRKASCAGH